MGLQFQDSAGNIIVSPDPIANPDQQVADSSGNLINPAKDETVAQIRSSVVSTANSTTTPLGIGGIFTGTVESVKDFSTISIFAHSDQNSATDGLEVQWSSDGINFDEKDQFTLQTAGTKIFTFGAAAQYFRIKYTNGGVAQSEFRLQAILNPFAIKPSSHRIGDAITSENDSELVKAVLTGQDVVNENFANVGVSNTRMLVSTEAPPAPPGTTNVSRTADGDISGSVDDVYVITSGKVLRIQNFTCGAASESGADGAKVELFDDPNGDGSVLNIITKAFLNGSNFQSDESFQTTGNGTRAIRLRRTHLSGGNLEIFSRWSGFET